MKPSCKVVILKEREKENELERCNHMSTLIIIPQRHFMFIMFMAINNRFCKAVKWTGASYLIWGIHNRNFHIKTHWVVNDASSGLPDVSHLKRQYTISREMDLFL